jgi:HEAT repeat protein
MSLGVLMAREAREELQRAASGSDKRLAQAAIGALGMLADPASADFLARQAQSNPELAPDALAALAQLPGDGPRKLLEGLVRHKDDRVVRAAVRGLSHRKDAASVPTLLDALEQVSQDNGKAVQSALTKITGQRWSTAAQWRQWYAKEPR